MNPRKRPNHLPQENGKRRPKNQPKNIQSRVMMSHAPKNKKIATLYKNTVSIKLFALEIHNAPAKREKGFGKGI